jgi:hypothetical protein
MFEGLLTGIGTQFIPLPVEARDQIVPRLQEFGIEVGPSSGRKPRRLENAGAILTCSRGNAAVDVLIVRDDFLPEPRNMTFVLVLPSSGFVSEFRHRAERSELRKTISAALHELREEASSRSGG